MTRTVGGLWDIQLKAWRRTSFDNTRLKIVVLHYSPIEATLAGEAREIYAFLGSSWLGDALDRYGVHCAVHGHAHGGSPEGRTRRNIPVYNVSRFVRTRMGGKPYLLLEV